MTDEWYYRLFGEEFGPVSLEVLQRTIRGGQLTEDDDVRANGSVPWMKVREFAARGYANRRSSSSGMTLLLDDDRERRSGSDSLIAAVDDWFCDAPSMGKGPHPFEDLLKAARLGVLNPDDRIRLGKNGAWRRAGSMGRLMAVMPYQSPDTVAKSRPVNIDSADDEFEFNGVTLKSETPPDAASNPRADDQWFAQFGGLACGPMRLVDLMEWSRAGRIKANDSVKLGRNSAWVVANTVPGLIPGGAPAVPVKAAPMPAARPASPPVNKPDAPAITTVLKSVVADPAPKPAPPAVERPAAIVAPPSDMPPVTTMSTYGTGLGTPTPPRPAWTAPKKPPAPIRGKPPRSSGSDGGGLGSLLKDARVLGALGGVVAILLAIVGWSFLPEGTGKFKEPYQQIKAVQQELDKKFQAKPAESEWKSIGEAAKKKLEPIDKKLRDLNSGHALTGKLINAISALKGAASAASLESVETKLKQADKNLTESAKLLGI